MLQSGGHLLINSWSIAEIAFRNFSATSNSLSGEIQFDNVSEILFSPTRMETASKMTGADGSIETKTAIDFIYSINELETLLTHAGLVLKQVYSIPGKKKFTVGEPRAYIVAGKI